MNRKTREWLVNGILELRKVKPLEERPFEVWNGHPYKGCEPYTRAEDFDRTCIDGCHAEYRVYSRPFRESWAKLIRTAVDAFGKKPFKMPESFPKFGLKSRDLDKPALWGLVKKYYPEGLDRDPKKHGAKQGWWEVTDLGVGFAKGALKIPFRVVEVRGIIIEFREAFVSVDDRLEPDFDIRKIR